MGKIKNFIESFLKKKFDLRKNKEIILIINKNAYSAALEENLVDRFRFYFRNKKELKIIKGGELLFFSFFFKSCIKLNYGFTKSNRKSRYLLKSFLFFDVDFNNNEEDGWNWHNALTAYTFTESSEDTEIELSKKRFVSYANSIEKFEKSYALGTGPSLAKAINVDWSDGYRIVCNTIVRDSDLWNHIKPHFIVAGDAIYHFGHNSFAQSFISDLKNRLRESSIVFLYPFLYHSFLKDELYEFKERLIPIPTNDSDLIHVSLFEDFSIPAKIGNVLNVLLLPLATSLSKNVYLYGFDGRSPNDKLFWANSQKHSYGEKINEIQLHHPKFFDFHVPKNNENKYVHDVHGQKLERILSIAEQEGWSFTMMHDTWTETLKRRYNPKTKSV